MNVNKPALYLALLCFSSISAAASFDCRKSRTPVEKLICSEPALSVLDNTLDRVYRQVLPSSDEPQQVKNAQLAWMRQTRDACSTAQCLANAYEKRITELRKLQDKSRTSEAHCPVSESYILGAWERVSDTGFFEEMAFDKVDGVREFQSWLHQRPEMLGSWHFKKCVIHLIHRYEETMNFNFVIVRATQSKLYIKEVGDHDITVYKRIK